MPELLKGCNSTALLNSDKKDENWQSVDFQQEESSLRANVMNLS
ncbi:hypothetical protein ACQCVK_00135 [Rossellomorea vietnamensis]|nr:hypothetical protein [Rossellomorea aquimaris]